MNKDLRATLNRADETKTAFVIPFYERTFDAHIEDIVCKSTALGGRQALPLLTQYLNHCLIFGGQLTRPWVAGFGQKFRRCHGEKRI